MADQTVATVEVNRAGNLRDLPHGFLGRRGGVSTGVLKGLNVGPGSGDEAAAIVENRERAVNSVRPGAQLVTVYQVHSPECVTVVQPWEDDARPHADAMVTDRPDLLLGILTADCAPVLLADRVAGVVGAAHAGWRGALAGVTDRTIEAMTSLGAEPERIAAAIGPCIGMESYEVDGPFREQFLLSDTANAEHFDCGTEGHWQFDLQGYVRSRLWHAGVTDIEPLSLDTYAHPDRFYSYRRATHQGELNYGRQISLIGLV